MDTFGDLLGVEKHIFYKSQERDYL